MRAEPLPRPVQHFGVHVDQGNAAPVAAFQNGLRERARSGAEIDHMRGLSLHGGGGRARDHLVVVGQKATYGLVVAVDLKAQMAAHGVFCQNV